MNKKMRVLAMMLVEVMSIGVMTACSSNPKQTSSTDTTQKAETQSKDTAKEERKKEGPKKEETTNLTWWTIGGEPKDLKLVNDEINKYTKEKLNVTVDLKFANWGEYGEKLAKIIQSGEYYDIAFGASINRYVDLVSKGYFADIKDLLPTAAPALYEFIPEELWQGVTLNDQIFGVPTYKDSSHSQYWLWDKEVVDRLGIDYENINTLEDMEPAIRKIKEDDPTSYPFMLTSSGINSYVVALNEFDTFIANPQVGIKFTDETATVVSPWDDESSMENFRILHRWFNEGLINPDAATLTEGPKWQPVGTGQGFPHAWPDKYDHLYYGPVYYTGSIQGSFQVISAGSKYVEESLQLLELFNTDTYARNLLGFGIEGTHYEKIGDNTIKQLNDSFSVPHYSQATFFNLYVVDPAPATKWKELQELTEQAVPSPALGFVFDTQLVQNQIAACSNIQMKYQPQIITGSVDPDVAVPKMMKELNKAGYQDIITEAQKQLDAYLGK